MRTHIGEMCVWYLSRICNVKLLVVSCWHSGEFQAFLFHFFVSELGKFGWVLVLFISSLGCRLIFLYILFANTFDLVITLISTFYWNSMEFLCWFRGAYRKNWNLWNITGEKRNYLRGAFVNWVLGFWFNLDCLS